MTEVSEQTDREINELEILTQNVAALTAAVQTLDDVLLVILHNMKEFEIPEWESIQALEKDVSKKIVDSINAVRKAYGPVETDKD